MKNLSITLLLSITALSALRATDTDTTKITATPETKSVMATQQVMPDTRTTTQDKAGLEQNTGETEANPLTGGNVTGIEIIEADIIPVDELETDTSSMQQDRAPLARKIATKDMTAQDTKSSADMTAKPTVQADLNSEDVDFDEDFDLNDKNNDKLNVVGQEDKDDYEAIK